MSAVRAGPGRADLSASQSLPPGVRQLFTSLSSSSIAPTQEMGHTVPCAMLFPMRRLQRCLLLVELGCSVAYVL